MKSDFDRAMRHACAEMAAQEDAALVAAMAHQAREDAALIEGAGLDADEARWVIGELEKGVN